MHCCFFPFFVVSKGSDKDSGVHMLWSCLIQHLINKIAEDWIICKKISKFEFFNFVLKLGILEREYKHILRSKKCYIISFVVL